MMPKMFRRKRPTVDLEEYLYIGAVACFRRYRGLSLRKVAKSLGVPRRYLWRLEHGYIEPRMSVMRRYCLAVGTEIRYEVLSPEEVKDARESAQEDPVPAPTS